MKVFMTGATGFIGGAVARDLRARGDDVRALVRTPVKATALTAAGCEIVEGDLSSTAAIERGLEGCDAAIHAAALYEVGVPRSRRRALWDTNVAGTERVLDAARRAGTPKIIYVSTVAAFGNTRGAVVDETAGHSGEPFTSVYEETKVAAHDVARRFSRDGLPVVIVQPGGVYGPGDTSLVATTIDLFLKGRLPLMAFPDLGINFVHVDDASAGILLALDGGKAGESYVLGGEIMTLRGAVDALAAVTGRRAPTRTVPAALIKLGIPFGPVLGPLIGFPPNFRELIASADGVTYWASHDKAVRELGYRPRRFEEGVRDMLAAQGRL